MGLNLPSALAERLYYIFWLFCLASLTVSAYCLFAMTAPDVMLRSQTKLCETNRSSTKPILKGSAKLARIAACLLQSDAAQKWVYMDDTPPSLLLEESNAVGSLSRHRIDKEVVMNEEPTGSS